MTLVTAPQEATQLVGESIKYSASFANLLTSGESITGLASVTEIGSNTDATITQKAFNSPNVVFRFAGATAGQQYRVRITVTTNYGNTRQGDVIINVE